MRNVNQVQQLKSQIQKLTMNAESIQKNNDISGSIVRLNKTLNDIKPIMDKQTGYINNFLQVQISNDSSSKQSQIRRYLNRIQQISTNQFKELLTSGQMYFNIEIKKSWPKIKSDVEKDILLLREKTQQMNVVEFVFSINNARDRLFKDFLRSIMYRKKLIMQDLNLTVGGFAHSQNVAISKMMEDYYHDIGFIPTKPYFKPIDFDSRGRWSLQKNQEKQISLSQLLKLLDQQIQDIFTIIRNYSGLNKQQLNNSEIQRNQKVLISLRRQIQKVHQDYQILQKKYRETINKQYKSGQVQLKEKLKQYEQTLQLRDIQLKQLKLQTKDSSNQLNQLREKVKSLEDDLNKVTNLQMIKLDQIQVLQKTLVYQLQRISSIINNFAKMFELQSFDKKSLGNKIIAQNKTIQKMAQMLGNQKIKNSDLQLEINRLNKIILQLGARINEIKQNQINQ